MEILLIFIFFITFGLLIVKICFILILKEKITRQKITINIADFANFEISASL